MKSLQSQKSHYIQIHLNTEIQSEISDLKFSSTGNSSPKTEINFFSLQNYSTQYNHDPMRDIYSPVKVLINLNDKSPTNYKTKSLSDCSKYPQSQASQFHSIEWANHTTTQVDLAELCQFQQFTARFKAGAMINKILLVNYSYATSKAHQEDISVSHKIEDLYAQEERQQEKEARRKERQPNKRLQDIRGEMSDALSKLELKYGLTKDEQDQELQPRTNSKATKLLENFKVVSDLNDNL